MSTVFKNVMDAIDIETFLVCSSESEGKELAIRMVKDMGIQDADIVFIQYQGPGARVRVRGYVYKPGASYGWLNNKM